MKGWNVEEARDDGMVIQLDFNDPTSVSQGELPDLFLIQVEMSEYYDIDHLYLEESVVKVLAVPRQ